MTMMFVFTGMEEPVAAAFDAVFFPLFASLDIIAG
jgi:hypothetical protein